MSKKKSTILAIINKMLSGHGILNLSLASADGKEIVFEGVEDDATPNVGDKATVDGAADYTGELTLSDGKVYRFENGELKEILEKQAETENTDQVEQITNLTKELADLKAKFEATTAKLTTAEESNKKMKEDFKNLKRQITSGDFEDIEDEEEEEDKDKNKRKPGDKPLTGEATVALLRASRNKK